MVSGNGATHARIAGQWPAAMGACDRNTTFGKQKPSCATYWRRYTALLMTARLRKLRVKKSCAQPKTSLVI